MEIQIFDTEEEVIESYAKFIVEKAKEALKERGRFTLVLSGGNSPKRVYELLATEKYNSAINWSQVDFFFGDERYVPFESERNNARMALNSLLRPLELAAERIHIINTTLPVEEAARDYFSQIEGYFSNEKPVFDLVLLGLGSNAHTASLFPHTTVLHAKNPDVKPVFLKDEQVWRITLTAPLINAAHDVAFLTFGEDKSRAVWQIIKGEKDTESFPAQLIKPTSGTLHWFLDQEAASLIQAK